MVRNEMKFCSEICCTEDQAEAILAAWKRAYRGTPPPCLIEVERRGGDLFCVFSDDDGSVDMEKLAVFLQGRVLHLDLPPIALEWAAICPDAEPGQFGGGALVISQQAGMEWLSTGDWTEQRIDEIRRGEEAKKGELPMHWVRDNDTCHLEGAQLVIAQAVLRTAKHYGSSLHTGGCRTFYTPQEWRQRGESYGLNSQLIVCYEGSAIAPFFNMEHGCDGWYTAMQGALNSLGFYSEECTSWYSAIYKI